MSRSILVFCGANTGSNPAYRAQAAKLGAGIAARGWRLIYGGGGLGLMREVADAAMAAGGAVTGVIVTFLRQREAMHPHVQPMLEVSDMHQRKQTMLDLADAIIALPGGAGTLDELLEAITWARLGLHRKPIVLVSPDQFWAPFEALMDHVATEGFVPHWAETKPVSVASATAALQHLETQLDRAAA